jgi:lysosomal alpha-mannosidase
LGRVDYQDKDIRGKNKTREMLWQASRNLGISAQLFTGILHNGYGPPDGFWYTVFSSIF